MDRATNDISASKQELRERIQSRRQEMDKTASSELSLRIVRQLLELEYLREARCVHAFWPIHEKREVDLRPLIRELVSRGVCVALPVVTPATETGAARMEHRRFGNEHSLVKSALGILEPTNEALVDPTRFDVVLVPALAVDTSGCRLGYGMGFYDRFLSDVEALRICAIYDEDVMTSVPCEVHDQRMDVVVTQRRILYPSRT